MRGDGYISYGIIFCFSWERFADSFRCYSSEGREIFWKRVLKIGRRRIVYTFGKHGPLWFDCPSCIRSGNNDDNSLTGIFANDVIPLSARGRLVDTWKPEFWNAWRHSYNGSLTTRHLSCSYSRQMTLRRLPAERERIRPTFQPFVHRSRFSFLFHFATTQILEINKKKKKKEEIFLNFLIFIS